MSDLYNKNWHVLDINITDAIRSDFNFDNLLINADYVDRNKSGVWGYDGDNLTTIFSEQWLEYMKSIQLEVIAMLIFYRKPYFVHPEGHIDFLYGENKQTSIALNWVVSNDDNSHMCWYTTPTDAIGEIHRIIPTGHGHTYTSWPTEELTEIDRHIIGDKPTVVRVDIPHNILMNNSPRWAVSVRCKTPYATITWPEIVDYIKPKILND